MKKVLNIWSVSHYASTPDSPGIQRAYQYAKAFAHMGHLVTLWRSSYNHWSRTEAIKDHMPYHLKEEENLNIISLKTKPLYERNDHRRFLNMVSFAYSMIRISKTIPSIPDVIIASYPSPFAAFAANVVAHRYNAKFILEIGDLWPQCWVERKAFSRYHPFVVMLYAIEKYLHKRTKIYVSSLPYVNEYLNEKGIEPDKFIWIPNPVNLEAFNINSSQNGSTAETVKIISEMKMGSRNGKMNVIYIGSVGVANRVDCIVQAANILKDKGENDISFFIIGDGHTKKEIIKYVADNKLDSVTLSPSIPKFSVPGVLVSADVGVMCLNNSPIYRYGVNLNKIYDYMAAGLPIVFSASVRNNLVDDNNAGITVPPSNPAAIAKALQKIKSLSIEERLIIGKRGQKFIIENYNIDRLSNKYIKAIN